jgi:hypothetical protein
MSLLTSLVTGGCRQLREINESRLLKGDVNLRSKIKIKDKRRRSFLEVSVEIEGSAIRTISFQIVFILLPFLRIEASLS